MSSKIVRYTFIYVSIIIALFGTAHCLLTPYFYPTLTLDTMWFLGTGLSLIFLGTLHIGYLSATKLVKGLTLSATLIAFVFYTALMLILKEPQAGFVFILVLFQLLALIYLFKDNNAAQK